LLVHWTDRFGDERPLSGMAHAAGFLLPHLRLLLHAYGAVEATREGAAWARAHDVPLLLFPGGDAESMRPLRRAWQVDFHGRKGWVRLAREHGLDVVPMCISNSHHTLPLLPVPPQLAAWLTGARLFGVRRAPVPLHGAVLGALLARGLRRRGASMPVAGLAALASLYATAMIPVIPARIGFDILPPIPNAELAAGDDAVYARVVGALQATMDARRLA
jgi:1-acyl-sn-glycerol-3-phosphate acyltransferase